MLRKMLVEPVGVDVACHDEHRRPRSIKKDVMVKDGVVYLPLYMTYLLSRRS